MILEMKVPSPGESISEVQIAQWLKKTGDYVFKDEEIVSVDSDKATLAISAEESGTLETLVNEGDTVAVGSVICKINTDAKAPETAAPKKEEKKEDSSVKPQGEKIKEEASTKTQGDKTVVATEEKSYAKGTQSPVASKMIKENNINADKINGTGPKGRITKSDVLVYLANGFDAGSAAGWGGTRDKTKQKMSMLRKKVAERLVSVKNETAMLTTFNEIDMGAMMDLRKQYKELFEKKHGVGLGFMSFFTKAVTEALNIYPAVNAMIDGDEIVYHNYADIGIAVSAPKGLMVPVLRNAETMSLAEIEGGIKALALKARDGKLSIDEMTGGTFTITNGGVFGSLMSTPIINPPQVAILGMHKIQDRVMVINSEMKVRPMMYVALSYDHRIIDGKESVGFLVKVKEMLETPEKMLFGGKNPNEVLLGL
jgi:2-oxoglutarate dehydrogenase E2 component (dihydrolipoamide succinyltransferase)